MSQRAEVPSILLRFKPKDTMFGVSRETVESLCKHTGLNKTEVIHRALRDLADRFGI